MEMFVDFLVSRAIHVQMFFHYFTVLCCIFILHENPKVSRLAMYYTIILIFGQITDTSPEYFFHVSVGYELLLILGTVTILGSTRVMYYLVGLSALSIIVNILMYEFPKDTLILYEHYCTVNKVLLEATLGGLLYAHKSKVRNLMIVLVMVTLHLYDHTY